MTLSMERRATVVTPADWVPGPEQGHWTYNHYAALPDDGHRYEIVEGVLYMAPAPNIPHQRSVLKISRYLLLYVEDTGLGQVLIAPVDVELAPHMSVQPDVVVILNKSLEKITSSHIVGAPDLVVEVASPATADYDRRKKRDAYARARVSEYWIADPVVCSIEVYALEGDKYHSLGIFNGQRGLVSRIIPTISEIPVKNFFVQAL